MGVVRNVQLDGRESRKAEPVPGLLHLLAECLRNLLPLNEAGSVARFWIERAFLLNCVNRIVQLAVPKNYIQILR